MGKGFYETNVYFTSTETPYKGIETVEPFTCRQLEESQVDSIAEKPRW